MPVGLKFQRKHKRLGYLVKYLYYLVARRDILQKKTSFGNQNADKIIYLIKPDYQDGVEGLLSLIYKQVLYIDYAKKKGYVPYVDWKNYKTQYYDGINNAWEYFFHQPSELKEEAVYKSKNIYLSGWKIKNINSQCLFESEVFHDSAIREKSAQMIKNNLIFSDEVIEIAKEEALRLNVDDCIGVYVRGTDYVKLQPSGEYVQPSIIQVKEQIEVFMKKYSAPIYLVTEDGEIYDSMVSAFGNNIRTVSFDTFIRDYDGMDVLSKANVLDENKKRRGQNYLVKMILLSKCKYLISSMTQGSKFSYILNNGEYQDEFIFDLGLYP